MKNDMMNKTQVNNGRSSMDPQSLTKKNKSVSLTTNPQRGGISGLIDNVLTPEVN
jgi:hypothetical protein